MSNYRRAKDGNTYFFTVVTFNRQPILCMEPSRECLRNVIIDVRTDTPFVIEAWVLLPDHMHCIWRLPEGDTDYSLRWARIKAKFTKRSRAWLDEEVSTPSRLKHRDGTVWQRRYWEHMIRGDEDYKNHCDYIHYNPVKHGLVSAPKEWPYSTFHRFVRENLYPHDWGAIPREISLKTTGE